MITTALLNIVYVFVLGITTLIAQFGEVSANNSMTNAIVALKTYYTSLDAFLPLSTIMAIIAFDLAFEGIVFLYKMIRWAYQKVPMIN
jgi:hypothetical protein